MSELAVKRDRIFKMYERMCGRKPDMVVQDLLNLLMRDEMRPLVKDLIREHNRIEIVEKAPKFFFPAADKVVREYFESNVQDALFDAKYDHG